MVSGEFRSEGKVMECVETEIGEALEDAVGEPGFLGGGQRRDRVIIDPRDFVPCSVETQFVSMHDRREEIAREGA